MRALLPLSVLVLATAIAGCSGDGGGGDGEGGGAARPLGLEAHCPPATSAHAGEALTAVFDTSMGEMRARLFVEEVPHTVANFAALARDGYYNGTVFHRIITDFMMQGGQGAREADEIADEFRHGLRHDRKGLLSMANAGPDTGSSQFFITFRATPHLNDRHTVFGEVTQGLEVLDRVNAEAASSGGTPRTPVQLRSVAIESAPAPPGGATGLELTSFVATHPVAADGGRTGFVVTAENTGAARMDVRLAVQAPDGVATALECPAFQLAAGQRWAQVLRVAVPAGEGDVAVRVASAAPAAELTLTAQRSEAVGGDLARGDTVSADYVGLSTDGRVFDTSRQSVAQQASGEGLGYDLFRVRGTYGPFGFTIGSGVIEGFSKLADGMDSGGADAARLTGEDAYPWGPCSPQQSCLGGRELLFDLQATKVS